MFEASDTPAQQRRDLTEDQETQRETLAEDQAEERAGLEVDIVEDRREEHEGAQVRLPGETEATRQQNEELDTMIAVACAEVDIPSWDLCPMVQSKVDSVSDVDEGVIVRMVPGTGSVDGLQHRLDCYRARAVVRGEGLADNARVCLLDVPDVEMTVRSRSGHVELELTSAQAAGVTALRTRSRLL